MSSTSKMRTSFRGNQGQRQQEWAERNPYQSFENEGSEYDDFGYESPRFGLGARRVQGGQQDTGWEGEPQSSGSMGWRANMPDWQSETSEQRPSQWGRSSPGRRTGSFAGRGPQGYKRSDSRIEEDINDALTQDPDLDASMITVEVKNGDVTLRGTVPDRNSKRMAEDLAESCSGVKDVQNQLRVKREEDGEETRRGGKSAA